MNVAGVWIRGAFLILSGWLFFASAHAKITVFSDGRIFLPVMIAADALPAEREAAEELGRVLGAMSGLRWPVRTPSYGGECGFYVGRFAWADSPHSKLIVAKDLFRQKGNEVGPDAFRIRSGHGSIFIEAATPGGIGFAVDWFLQHEGGVRWYVPGAMGEVIPHRASWTLPELNILREPAYISREITGLNSPEEKLWARRNGLHSRVEFTHALANVFPRSVLEEHPEWSPLIEGKRHRPVSDGDQNWQPNLALQGVADYAAEAACAAFQRDPSRVSFSLGINDTVRFDQGESTRALVEPVRYFRGMPDYSPLVFTFMNRAAGEVSKLWPDRYLGCLAYFWCENPPSFRVHPNALPFVTTDRSQYFDEKYRAGDLALMSRWGASGVQAFGLWEYAYGRGFVVPRLYCRALAESIRAGWHFGARGYLAEVEPNWGFDAFKVWMLAQLMWEPDRRVEDLEHDFYSGYYGAAARPMRRFFELCEESWMSQRGTPRWLKYYEQEDQALLFPAETCGKLRRFLEGAAAAAKTPGEAIRVKETARAFDVTEAYVRFDGLRRALGNSHQDTLPSPDALADSVSKFVRLRENVYQKMTAASVGGMPAMVGSALAGVMRNDPIPRLLWLAGDRNPSEPHRILTVVGVSKNESRWWSIAAMSESPNSRMLRNLMENSAFLLDEVKLKEPRFLYPKFGILPLKWRVQAMPTENGRMAIVDNFADTLKKAIRIGGAYDAQLFQWYPVESGRTYFVEAQLRGNSSPGNDAALFLTFVDGAGKSIGTGEMQSLPKGVTKDWRTMVLADQAPSGAKWVGVGVGASGQDSDDWLETAGIELKLMPDGSR